MQNIKINKTPIKSNLNLPTSRDAGVFSTFIFNSNEKGLARLIANNKKYQMLNSAEGIKKIRYKYQTQKGGEGYIDCTIPNELLKNNATKPSDLGRYSDFLLQYIRDAFFEERKNYDSDNIVVKLDLNKVKREMFSAKAISDEEYNKIRTSDVKNNVIKTLKLIGGITLERTEKSPAGKTTSKIYNIKLVGAIAGVNNDLDLALKENEVSFEINTGSKLGKNAVKELFFESYWQQYLVADTDFLNNFRDADYHFIRYVLTQIRMNAKRLDFDDSETPLDLYFSNIVSPQCLNLPNWRNLAKNGETIKYKRAILDPLFKIVNSVLHIINSKDLGNYLNLSPNYQCVNTKSDLTPIFKDKETGKAIKKITQDVLHRFFEKNKLSKHTIY